VGAGKLSGGLAADADAANATTNTAENPNWRMTDSMPQDAPRAGKYPAPRFPYICCRQINWKASQRRQKLPNPHKRIVMREPPYYAVIFTSLRREEPNDGYGEMADRMEELAQAQPGFLGIESAHTPGGLGITVSYWATPADLAAWGRNAEHLLAQKFGREKWYKWFALRVCCVERAYEFTRPEESP
jgi:heme-degrading monooxygenase HmoA